MTTPTAPRMYLAWNYSCDEDLRKALSKVVHLPTSEPENYDLVEADFMARRLVVVGSDVAIRQMAQAEDRHGNG